MVSMHLVKGDSCPPLEIQPGIKKHSCTPCKGYCTSRVCTVHPLKILFTLALIGSIRKTKKGFACGNISMFQIGTRLNSPSLLYEFPQLHWRNTSHLCAVLWPRMAGYFMSHVNSRSHWWGIEGWSLTEYLVKLDVSTKHLLIGLLSVMITVYTKNE